MIPHPSLKKSYNQNTLQQPPNHIAVIMDGNGRWAKQKGLSRGEGHRAGAKTVDSLLDVCLELKIPVVSLYAFSTENWKRPISEIKTLFSLLDEYIENKLAKMESQNIRMVVSGDISKLPSKSRRLIRNALEKTKNNTSLIANFCLNYGSRDEILRAMNLLLEYRLKKDMKISKKITEREFSKYLYTSNLPDVDLLIRTSGEMRLSNFLLFQCAYAELYFSKKKWPDFKRNDFIKAVVDYHKRKRNFGGIG